MSKSKHTLSVQIISRGPNVWQGKCARHAVWTGPTYEVVEDEWRKHVHTETGKVPDLCGDRAGRWMP